MDLGLTPIPTRSLDDTEIETPTQSADVKSHYRRHLPPPVVAVAYKECMKNHAASIGGQAVDGCGEYMPTAALNCAACGCHRSFHRRSESTAIIKPPRPAIQYGYMLLPLSTAVEQPTTENPVRGKRFRTKFRQDQKEKMHCFAEKVGWKIRKSDEAAVEEFSREVGVSKAALKVWMHNNRNTNKQTSINKIEAITGD